MAWVRIHDGAMSHPKLVGLIDWKNPFCVWVWGLSYCQTHLTDGLIPRAAVPNPTALKTATRLITGGVWEAHDIGFKVHDYLEWNDSKDVVSKKRLEAKERMANARQRSSQEVRANFYVDRGVGERSEGEKVERSASPEDIADFFDLYRELWQKAYGYPSSLFEKALETMQAGRQIAAHGLARISAALRAYFAAEDGYVRKAKHPLPLFLRDPLKYLAKDAVQTGRPRGCRHEPACADDAAHTKRDLADRRQAS